MFFKQPLSQGLPGGAREIGPYPNTLNQCGSIYYSGYHAFGWHPEVSGGDRVS